MRNRIALVLLFLSWPVCVVHRIWNNDPERKVSWIVCDGSVFQDFRWYWVYNELWLSAFLVLAAFLVMTRKTYAIRITLWALSLVSLVDIVNYWLWFRRNEPALTLEGLIMLIAAITIITHASKSGHEKTT